MGSTVRWRRVWILGYGSTVLVVSGCSGDPAGDLQCTGAAGGRECRPFYDPEEALPGFDRVGACAVPP